MIDPAIESHYGIGYEHSRLFPGGRPSLEFVRSMELLHRFLPAPPARLLDVGGGPGAYAAPLARRGYRVHLVDPLPLHVQQARQAAGSDPAAGFTAAVGDARELSEPGESQDAVVLFGPLYHLTEAADRRQALGEARRVLRPGGRLLAMAVCRFASLLDGLYEGWLDDPLFRPIVDQDLADWSTRSRWTSPRWFWGTGCASSAATPAPSSSTIPTRWSKATACCTCTTQSTADQSSAVAALGPSPLPIAPEGRTLGDGPGCGRRGAGSAQQYPIVSVRASSMGATVSRSPTARASVNSAGDRSVGGMSGHDPR